MLQETLFGGVWITCYEGGRNAASGTSQASSFHKRHLFSGLRVFWSLWMLGLPLEVFWMLFKNRINPWRKCFAYSSWHCCFDRAGQFQLLWADSNKIMLIMMKNGPEIFLLHFWDSKIKFSPLDFVQHDYWEPSSCSIPDQTAIMLNTYTRIYYMIITVMMPAESRASSKKAVLGNT